MGYFGTLKLSFSERQEAFQTRVSVDCNLKTDFGRNQFRLRFFIWLTLAVHFKPGWCMINPFESFAGPSRLNCELMQFFEQIDASIQPGTDTGGDNQAVRQLRGCFEDGTLSRHVSYNKPCRSHQSSRTSFPA